MSGLHAQSRLPVMVQLMKRIPENGLDTTKLRVASAKPAQLAFCDGVNFGHLDSGMQR
jgi:hypothetical protein